jgi:hypothetical protein
MAMRGVRGGGTKRKKITEAVVERKKKSAKYRIHRKDRRPQRRNPRLELERLFLPGVLGLPEGLGGRGMAG